ncbi:MAG: galactokinase family protein [Oscillospiraceae bacterium]|nr:galactokinase [Oscillospiraceae bacterium]MDD7355194.1 galactokinase family protein [Oscillospiraceae bacterium]MDY3937096.1 galactokinase family protein [Oscillospiraceae bacterium]
MSYNDTLKKLESSRYDSFMKKIYFTDEKVKEQKERYKKVLSLYASLYGEDGDIRFFSAPGRSEVCGNHTDHNRGKVIAAAVNLDAVAAAAKNDENIVRVKSAEYTKSDIIDISVLEPVEKETGSSAALIRGVCRGFINRGYKIGGFNAATMTQVLSGSGLSSSAAFEVLIGTCLNYLYNGGKVSAVEVAQIAQYAENEFFGKPCGLMDQMACSVGGFVNIDFKDPSNPVITPIDFNFASCGHSLCIVDTRASHADLTDEYGAIRSEMESAAECFGKTALRDVDEKEFFENINIVREKVSERAVLRGLHFFGENNRVDKQTEALSKGDFETFKKLVIESGNSSYMYNQNVFSAKAPLSQPVSLALAMSEYILKGKGAWRVHGGGFAGTIQAFVPSDMLCVYKTEIEKVFGESTCYVLNVRPVGGCEIC